MGRRTANTAGMVPALAVAYGLPEPVAEHRFHDRRRWRFDYAWPDHLVALEVDGGVWQQGRHNRAAGYRRDLEKLNTAASFGWRVLRIMPDQINASDTWDWIRRLVPPLNPEVLSV